MFQHALYEKQRWWWDIISAVIYFIVQEMGWVFDEREMERRNRLVISRTEEMKSGAHGGRKIL